MTQPGESDSDPFTMSAKLCDDDGIVRSGSMHDGRDYPCTGHAHSFGEHIYCTSPGHARNREAPPVHDLPDDLRRLLESSRMLLRREGSGAT